MAASKTIHDRLQAILDDMHREGSVPITRLTVLKKWFEKPERGRSFGAWMFKRVAKESEKDDGDAAPLFRELRAVARGLDVQRPKLDERAAATLYIRLRDFQNEHRKVHWASVREIKNWDLLLAEQGLGLMRDRTPHPSDCYALVNRFCSNSASGFPHQLNGPSAERIKAIGAFIRSVERAEAETEGGSRSAC